MDYLLLTDYRLLTFSTIIWRFCDAIDGWVIINILPKIAPRFTLIPCCRACAPDPLLNLVLYLFQCSYDCSEYCKFTSISQLMACIMRLPSHPFDHSHLEDGPHLCQGHIWQLTINLLVSSIRSWYLTELFIFLTIFLEMFFFVLVINKIPCG